MSTSTLTPKKVFISLSVICLIAYAFFNSRFLLQGPEIVLANVHPNQKTIHTTSKDFSLQGTVKHSSLITINNRPIMVDESGNFNEKLLLSNGISIIDIYARDKFGKETRETIDVVYASGTTTPTIAYETLALRVQQNSTSTPEVQEEVVIDTTLSISATTTLMQATSSDMVQATDIQGTSTSSEF